MEVCLLTFHSVTRRQSRYHRPRPRVAENLRLINRFLTLAKFGLPAKDNPSEWRYHLRGQTTIIIASYHSRAGKCEQRKDLLRDRSLSQGFREVEGAPLRVRGGLLAFQYQSRPLHRIHLFHLYFPLCRAVTLLFRPPTLLPRQKGKRDLHCLCHHSQLWIRSRTVMDRHTPSQRLVQAFNH